MITDRGASLLLDPAHVTTAITDAVVTRAGHVHLSGYPLLDPASRPAGLAALAAARARGLTTSVDAASADPLRRSGGFLEWVRGADLLLCNTDEADVLAGAGDPVALSSAVRNVVVKRGAAGAIWCTGGRVVATAAGPPVPMIDPTGAGDAFAAGLLAAWSSGADPAEALAAGTTLGAEAVGKIGARP
jgi:sugar/nucleoside kinase (ribokinase family)